MARTMHLPSEGELPAGPVRDFAELLFGLYRKAHRPALRDVSEAIRRNDDLHGTASPETIRRMLLGTTVPVRWAIVEAVYLTLCDLAGLDPGDAGLDTDNQDPWGADPPPSVSSLVEAAWHKVLDDPHQSFRQPARRDSAGFDPSGGPPGWDDDDI
jgi:hypothetical protein